MGWMFVSRLCFAAAGDLRCLGPVMIFLADSCNSHTHLTL